MSAIITITNADPLVAIEIAWQLLSANAGLSVQSVRKEMNSRTYRVIICGRPDSTGVAEGIETNKQAIEALRREIAVAAALESGASDG